MSKLRKNIKQYIEMKIEERKMREVMCGYDEACEEMKEITNDLQNILDNDLSSIELMKGAK